MAKKTTTTKQNHTEPSWFAALKTFFTNERTRFITGLIISILTIYVGLALISFFFTGAADQSKNRECSFRGFVDQSRIGRELDGRTRGVFV